MTAHKPALSHSSTTGRDIENRRLRYVFNFSAVVGGLILMLFAWRQLNSDSQVLKYALFATAACIWGTFLYVYFSGKVKIGSYIASAVVCGLILALTYTGGQSNTGLYWVYPLFFIQFIFLGAFLGTLVTATLIGIIALMLSNNSAIPADYADVEVQRAMASLLTLVALSTISEFFRHRSHQDLSTQHTDKLIEAVTDPLTGLTNRRFLDAFYLPDCQRNEAQKFPMAVILCDVDHFKQINDSAGHQTGDGVLIKVARLLAENVRSEDVVSRIGGEEFLILAQQANAKNGHGIAEKLRKKLEQAEMRELTDGVTASFGVAQAASFRELNDAMARADKLLYEAKHQGRNQVVSQSD